MTPVIILDSHVNDSERLRSEFVSLPGMCLTVPQVARLLDVAFDEAGRMLAELEGEGLLVHSAAGSYRRASPLFA